jgi:hypothetical protein
LCKVKAYWRDEDEPNEQKGADSDASHSFPRRVCAQAVDESEIGSSAAIAVKRKTDSRAVAARRCAKAQARLLRSG